MTKPFWQSLGVVGLMVEAALLTAEKQGILPEGTVLTLAEFAALVVALYGRVRATQAVSVFGG